ATRSALAAASPARTSSTICSRLQAVRDHERLGKAAPLPALKPLERVKGIEPSSSAWKSFGQPLHTRLFLTNTPHVARPASNANSVLSESPCRDHHRTPHRRRALRGPGQRPRARRLDPAAFA